MAAGKVCVGVDLGAACSVVAVSRRGRVEVIANDSGSRTTPSVVGYLAGDTYVGEAARDLPAANQLYEAKCLLGRRLTDPAVQARLKDWPFQVTEEDGRLKMQVQAGGQAQEPQQVCAAVLKSLAVAAEDFLSQPVTSAVLAVPPHFSEEQRAALTEAGALAGLEVVHLLDEAEAAVAAYGVEASKIVLVLHMGSRFTHVWLRAPGRAASSRHAELGGSSIDQRLLQHALQDIRSRHQVAVLEPGSVLELLAECELVKRKLSRHTEVTLSVPLHSHQLGYKTTVSRAILEDISADLLKQVADMTVGVLEDAGVERGAVDEVVLVGGSTRIPRVRAMLRDLFGGKELRHSINPDEAVAYGAAVHAATLSGHGAPGVEVELKEDENPVVSSASSSSSSRLVDIRTPKQSSTGAAIGIDLGTTYSAVAACRKGKVHIVCDDSGSRTVPSVVGFLGGESLVGLAARDLPAANQVYDAKRLIGRSWCDLDVQADMKHWPFQVVMVDGVPKIRITVDDKTEEFFPEEISAMVLRALKETAEGFLRENVTRAVITVPAYFNERQRQATKDAGKIAGLEVLAMINEPTAAAIAYGLDKKSPSTDKKTIFIFDLGGGTFDVSVMTIEGNQFKVVASSGDTHLGGQDFDTRLMVHFLEDIRAKHSVEQLDPQAMQDLRKACELAKRKLSSLLEAPVCVFSARCGLQYRATISRAHFEDLCADLFRRAMELTESVLTDAELERGAVDEVVLVGGSTRIPRVRTMLRDLFGGKELRHSINPDEAVAYGAAVHAAVLSGHEPFTKLVDLKDVTPLSLGVDIVGGLFRRVIPKNSPIPCSMTKEFYTVYDNQSTVDFEVFQGERELVKDNHSLNKEFSIAVPLKPKGEVKMDITFQLDADGLLTVTCVERSTGERRQVTITQEEARLSEDDVKAMVERAERFRQQDQEAKERIQAALELGVF